MFFIVWQGWGFLAVVIPLISAMLVSMVFHGAGLPVGLLVGAGLTACLGYRLNNRPGKTYIDKDSGHEVVFRKQHTLFGMPMHYSGILWAALSLYMLIILPH